MRWDGGGKPFIKCMCPLEDDVLLDKLLHLKGLCKISIFYWEVYGTTASQYFASDLDPFNGRNKHFPIIFPR